MLKWLLFVTFGGIIVNLGYFESLLGKYFYFYNTDVGLLELLGCLFGKMFLKVGHSIVHRTKIKEIFRCWCSLLDISLMNKAIGPYCGPNGSLFIKFKLGKRDFL